MQTVALTTREHSALLLLISTAEVKPREISPHVDILAAHADGLIASADDLIDGLLGINILVLLIDITQFDRLTHGEGSCIGLLQTHDQTEQRGLSRTVRTNDTYNAIWRQHEIKVAEQRLLGIGFCHMLGLDHLIAQTRTVGDEDLKLLLLLLLLFIQHHLIGVQTGLTFGMTGLRCHTHPLQLALQRLAAL